VLKALTAAFGGCQQGYPSWSPDSRRIVFACEDRQAIWITAANGGGLLRLTTGMQPDWSPDGRWIVFSASFTTGRAESLYKIHPNRAGLTQLTQSKHTYGTAGDNDPDW
jgi:Tol biopolymer transport system component